MPNATPGAETPTKEAGPPDVKAIMADIRRKVQREPAPGAPTEKQFLANVRDRLNQPLGRGFTDDFVESMRTRDGVAWNVELRDEAFRSSPSPLVRGVRWLLSPLFRVFVSTEPVIRQVARQAEINEYFRRLLVATSKDLERARLELDAIKHELRRLGVHVEFAFADSKNGSDRGAAPGRGRGEGRRPARPRQRGEGRRGGSRDDGGSAGRRDGGRSRSGRSRKSREN